MLDFDFLDRVISGFNETHIIVRSDQCIKLRYPSSKCQKCVDSCPVSAINLEEKMILDQYQCTSCGICTRVCPTGVFALKQSIEGDVLSQLRECLRRGDRAYLVCEKVNRGKVLASEDSLIQFPCLGIVDESLLLLLAMRGLRETRLIVSECGNCPNKQALDLIDQTVRRSQELFQTLNLEECRTGTMTPAGRSFDNGAGDASSRKVNLSRRELLTDLGSAPLKLGRSVGRAVMTSFFPDEERDRGKPGRNMPDRHRRMIQVLQELVTDDIKDTKVGCLPMKRVRIDQRCSGCGVCSTLCPTDALLKREKRGKVVIDFALPRCVACGVCEEACHEKALCLEDRITIGQLMDNSYRKLWEVAFFHCSVCKSRYFSKKEEEICPSCLKRKNMLF